MWWWVVEVPSKGGTKMRGVLLPLCLFARPGFHASSALRQTYTAGVILLNPSKLPYLYTMSVGDVDASDCELQTTLDSAQQLASLYSPSVIKAGDQEIAQFQDLDVARLIAQWGLDVDTAALNPDPDLKVPAHIYNHLKSYLANQFSRTPSEASSAPTVGGEKSSLINCRLPAKRCSTSSGSQPVIHYLYSATPVNGSRKFNYTLAPFCLEPLEYSSHLDQHAPCTAPSNTESSTPQVKNKGTHALCHQMRHANRHAQGRSQEVVAPASALDPTVIIPTNPTELIRRMLSFLSGSTDQSQVGKAARHQVASKHST
ncbi:hypothetical protein BKA62DRAFT_677127 [Auriculariales sp. MPI-PUGE-AT-0066]|nr:hypothetical protein BKA62DRAFT_677127 [Auriculariales sp. MPI-PUGE-AT-0066]